MVKDALQPHWTQVKGCCRWVKKEAVKRKPKGRRRRRRRKTLKHQKKTLSNYLPLSQLEKDEEINAVNSTKRRVISNKLLLFVLLLVVSCVIGWLLVNLCAALRAGWAALYFLSNQAHSTILVNKILPWPTNSKLYLFWALNVPSLGDVSHLQSCCIRLLSWLNTASWRKHNSCRSSSERVKLLTVRSRS